MVQGYTGAVQEVENRRVRHCLFVYVLQHISAGEKRQYHQVDLSDQPLVQLLVGQKFGEVLVVEVVFSEKDLGGVKADDLPGRDRFDARYGDIVFVDGLLIIGSRIRFELCV